MEKPTIMSGNTDKTDKTEPAEPAAELSETTTFQVPENLSELEPDALAELTSRVQARGAELAARAEELDDEELAEGEALGAVAVELAAEAARRTAAAAERTERAQAALSRFATATVTEPEPPPVVEDEPVEPVVPEDQTQAEEPEAVTAAAPRRTNFRGASPAFVKSKAPADAPKAKEDRQEFMVATAFSKDPENTGYDSPMDVANALWRKRMSFGNIPAGTHEMISIATGTKTFGDDVPTLGLDPQENLVALNEMTPAVVASGAFCTPQTQLYNFFRQAQPIRDVEDAIPTVQAPRGGIRFIAANCNIAGAGAVGRYRYDPDTAGGPESEDPDFEKPCARVSCPEIDEVIVEAITQCVIFDNLQYRTFPELIANFMEDVAIQFTLRKQRYYLDRIDAASTATTGIGTYGAARSLFYDWTIAAQAYRKRHHMPRGAPLELMAPDWAIDVIKADMFNDGDSGLDYMNVPDSAVEAGLASRNLSVTWYYDDPTSFMGQNPLTTAQPGAKAPLNDFPAEVVSFLYGPGTFVKLDGGTLDLGLVRDHALNKKNDFAMFMEEWLGFAQLGCESVRIDSLVCPSGARAPYASSLRACASAVS